MIQAEQDFTTIPKRFISLANEQQLPINHFAGQTVYAVAGIADPARFFKMLEELDIHIIPHVFPDHHFFKPTDLKFEDDKPVLMTAKDAVKCTGLNLKNAWYLEIETQISDEFAARFFAEIKS